MTLRELQDGVTPSSKPHDILMALFNELGSLNVHCRKNPCQSEEDAIGSIVILLAEYCSIKGFKLQDIVERAWKK